MAKIIIKSEKKAPFRRIFHVKERIFYVSPIIDHVLGCYQCSDIFETIERHSKHFYSGDVGRKGYQSR